MMQDGAGFLREIVEVLDSAGIPLMLTGSFASSFHGKPRATQDLDIIIAPTEEGLAKLVAALPKDRFYVDAEAAREAYGKKTQFNVIESRTGWKADLIVLKGRPFSQNEFQRRTLANILGVSLHVATAEDLILAKMEWGADGVSTRQLEDAAGILRTRGTSLDTGYINLWVGKLGLEPEWEKTKRLASPKN